MSSTPIVTQVDTAFNIEPGATMPIVISGESGTFVVFRIAGSNDSWGVLNCATVRIRFGEPNDEDLPNHPLYQYGLGYYGIFVIKNSPWISELVQSNDAERGSAGDLMHVIATFHDSTFECLTTAFSVTTKSGSLAKVIASCIQSVA